MRLRVARLQRLRAPCPSGAAPPDAHGTRHRRGPVAAHIESAQLPWSRQGFVLQILAQPPLARHPGEVYLMALRVEGLEPGLYHYHSARHRLEVVRRQASQAQASRYCAHQDYAGNAAALFLMTAVFPRTMWKYHRPRAYRVVLLDAGHLAQTFCLMATWLGLAPFCTAALKDTLIEKDLGIDGVRESILYVLGVGQPAKATKSKRDFVL